MFTVILQSCDSVCTIVRALRGVQSQLYPFCELVVVERGRMRATERTIEAFSRRVAFPVRWVALPGADAATAWNTGLDHCQGRYAVLQTADDVLMPPALEFFAHQFERCSDMDICLGRAIVRDRQGHLHPAESLPKGSPGVVEALLLRGRSIPLASLALRRSRTQAIPFFAAGEGNLPLLQWLLRLDDLFRCDQVMEDVAIVDHRQLRLSPEEWSRRCALLEQHFAQRPLLQIEESRLRAHGLARQHALAARAWEKGGDWNRAYSHWQAASTHAPLAMNWTLRRWWAGSRQWWRQAG